MRAIRAKKPAPVPCPRVGLLEVSVIAALAVICAATMVLAETPPTVAWIDRYDGSEGGNDQVTAMDMDAAGNIYVTGYSSGTWWDIATVKYAPDGSQLAAVRFNGVQGGDDVPYAVEVDANGNVYVAGYSDGNGQYNYDLILIKYNSSLVQQWVRTYAGQGNVDNDEAYDIAIDASGNIYVTGFSFEATSDYVTIKYRPDGMREWVRRYDGPAHDGDGAQSVVVDDLGGVYVTGISGQTPGEFNNDCFTIKYDTNGVVQWGHRFEGTGHGGDSGIALDLDDSRNVYVAGYATGTGTNFDLLTIKYDTNGTIQWSRTYDGPNHKFDSALAIDVDGAGNVCVTGDVFTASAGTDYATVKYDTLGNQEWAATYDGPVHGYDEGQKIVLDDEGNVYVTGYSDGGVGMVDYDYATVKYGPGGQEQWVVRYDGPGDNIDVAAGLSIDDLGSVVVSGWSTGTVGTTVDFATIRYDQNGAVDVPHDAASGQVVLFASPNPFESSTTLHFALSRETPVVLQVFDLSGRAVQTLLDRRLPAGNHSVDFDAKAFAPGVYFYSLQAEGKVRSGKLVRRQ